MRARSAGLPYAGGASYALFALANVAAFIAGWALHALQPFARPAASRPPMRDNELRVEYLGASVRRSCT